ncbi:MAG: DUF4199 domain-containing protein [Thermoanaerobaculia bacterium]
MKRTVLVWGLISGAVSSGMMLLFLPFADRIGFERGEILGYASIVLAALLVFFGIRSYREHVGGGKLTFGRGFLVGLMITLVSTVCYVATWELVYFRLAPDFGEKYTAWTVEKARRSGATEEKVAEIEQQAAEFKKMYDNPLVNIAFTFLEPFPFGLVAAAISAGILKKR